MCVCLYLILYVWVYFIILCLCVFQMCVSVCVCECVSDPTAGWHPAAGGPGGPQDGGGPPECLRSPEEPGLRQGERRQQDRLQELRRHPCPGATAAEDLRRG